MKKTLLLLLAVMLTISIMTSCGNEKKTDASETEKATVAVEEETEDTTEPEEEEEPIEKLGLGDKIDNDIFCMTFDSVDFPDGETKYYLTEYSYMTFGKDGYQSIIFQGHFENKKSTKISNSAIYAECCINDDYITSGMDVDLYFKTSASHEIDGYCDFDYILVAYIPQKLADKYEKAELTIKFNNDMSLPHYTFIDGKETLNEMDNTYVFSTEKDNEVAQTSGGENTTAAPVDSNKPLVVGETINAGDYDFTLKSIDFSYEVTPPNTSSFYSSYTADSGKVYVDVVAEIKNTSQRNICVRDLCTASVLYDGKYPYKGFSVFENDNDLEYVSSYIAATPLESTIIHSIVECPDEVNTSGSPVVVLIPLGGTTYEYKLR